MSPSVLICFCFLSLLSATSAIRKDENWLKQMNENVSRNIKENKPLHTSFHGVTARLSGSESFFTDEPVIFDSIYFTEGDGYDVNTGRYTCPETGVYFVSLNIDSYGTSTIYLEVLQDSVPVFQINNDNVNYTNYDNTDSNNGLVMCNQGEQIWVESFDSFSYVSGSSVYPLSGFTIMLMYQEAANFHTGFIGFSSWKTDDESYMTSDRISFDQVSVNMGNNYNPFESQFTCPVSGIYAVFVNFRKSEARSLQLGVAINTINMLHSSNVNVNNTHVTLSNSRLFQCETNDVVYVVATGNGEVTGSATEAYTTFSIMLMHQNNLSSQHQSFIGFTAWKQSTQSHFSGDVIEFEGVLINEGSHYNTTTHSFICPVAGVYYVTVSIKRFLIEPVYVDVRLLSQRIFRLSDYQDLNSGNTVTNSALVRCFPGEYIRVVGGSTGAVDGDVNEAYSTFTVFLMYQY